jgi:hypothetical protein
MKKILLASVALTAFAGAAAAEVSFGGKGTLGYNNEAAGSEDGFYWTGTLNISAEQQLDNGLTAAGSFNFEFSDTSNANSGLDLTSDDFVVSLSSEAATLTFGDTGTAAAKHWKSAGDMESDGFTSDWTDFGGSTVADQGMGVLRGDVAFGNMSASVSTVLDSNEEAAQTSVGITADLGMATVVAAYEDAASGALVGAGDGNADEILGISAAFAAAGANIVVAYADNSTDDTQSTGLKVSYPVGDVTVSAYYVDESNADANTGFAIAYAANGLSATVDLQDDQGTSKTTVDVSYDLGNGLTVMAGTWDVEGEANAETYFAASYDLGGGATLLASYADPDADIDGDDEIGPGDYKLGTTVELTFAF